MTFRQLPDVSILIVNYNVKDFLLSCLRSIAETRGTVRYEIIVVDNASTDSSVLELSPMFPEVRWIALDQNIGFGRGNNTGLAQCTGRYVLFLNPDTIIGADTLQVMVEYLDSNPEVGLAGCKVLNSDGTFQVACRRGFPTPWASFCKLFGLQSLFHRSPLFAQYNQLFRSIDETYDIDALIGAFMIGPRDLLEEIGGFDPDFFMYGEDLDLCYRIQQKGRKIRYVHSTHITHFKGESTRRSSMNEVRVFYQAMEIFARKHFGTSTFYLLFLRFGIRLRGLLERVLRKRMELLTMMFDVIGVNTALLVSTTVRFDHPFGFPDYAYPIVPISLTAIVVISLMAVGEYIEHRPSIRRSWVGLLVAFYITVGLSYFFKDFAFSRGVVLMTTGITALWFALVRSVLALHDTMRGRRAERRILLVGLTEATERIHLALQTADRRSARVVGVVSHGPYTGEDFAGLPVIGTTDYLDKLVREHGIGEVIVADSTIGQDTAMRLMIACSRWKARFHLAAGYDDIVTARVINDVAGVEPTINIPRILSIRNRVIKRTFDIVVALFVLSVAFPVLILSSAQRRGAGQKWLDVLRGVRSVVGLYPDGKLRSAGKEGLTGLVHISGPSRLSTKAIVDLNDFYVERYSVPLDIEILLHTILRRTSGNERYPRV